MTIFLPGVLRSPLNGPYLHWSKHRRWVRTQKERAEMHILAEYGLHPYRDHPSVPKVVTFTVYAYNQWDDDNLRAACKPYRDALTSMEIIDDDRPSAGHRFEYAQKMSRGKGAKRGLEITVALAELTPAHPGHKTSATETDR